MEAVLQTPVEEPPRIVVPRRWIGAPESRWNPTVVLLITVVAAMAGLVASLLAGSLSPWLAIPALGLGYYAIFTPLHDATHGVAHRNRSVNAVIGRLTGFALMLPYPLFRAAHLTHHAHTNVPGHDPDLMVARSPRWLAPLWFLRTPLHYRAMVYGRRMLRTRSAQIEAALTEVAIVAVVVGAIATGHGEALLQLWILPAALAILLLAFAFDLLPHHPHTTRERYYDTRVYPGRVLNALLLGQNYHLIHHLWTTIPWYHYEDAFRDVESDLVARGAPIGWRRLAERP